jgi:hypothetical protein
MKMEGKEFQIGSNGQIGPKSMDWFHLDQDRAQWLSVVNMVISLRVT